MIPSVLAHQVRQGVEDFLRTTFPISTPFFHGLIERLLAEEGGILESMPIINKCDKSTAHLHSSVRLGAIEKQDPWCRKRYDRIDSVARQLQRHSSVERETAQMEIRHRK